MSAPVTSGHLCSGYDGLGMALDLAIPQGHRALWHAEIDEDASATLAKHEPDVRNVGDLVQLVLDDKWRLAPRPDVVTAGFPCQPVSAAGRQLAELDHRWLWPFILRILQTVRPAAVFLENVQNLAGIQSGAILRGILGDLQAAGYESRWAIVGACAVGAPHHRHRWFLLARHVGATARPPVRVGAKTFCGAPRTVAILLPTPTVRDGDGRGEGDEAYWRERGAVRNNGMPLGAAVALLPTPRASDGPDGGPNQRNGRGEYDSLPGLAVNLLPTPTTSNSHGNEVNSRGEILLPDIAADPERWGKYAEAVALWEQITGTPAPEPTEAGAKDGRRMSSLLPEWMMGLPTGHLTGHLPRSAAIKQAGNGVVPLQAAAAFRLLAAG